jgi:serine/threonine protein kinase
MHEKELVGVTLGTCTIERVVGKGGMSVVFLAQQSRPVRTVAVKVLVPPANESDPDRLQVFLERFQREADTVARLEHKNILPVYEYAEATIDGETLAYLVMPYIRGGTLRQRIDDAKYGGQRIDLPTVSSYIQQVADALQYAHSLGVVHRDIKPGNLLFHSDGRLLLGDFGIVYVQTMPALTLVGSFVGTAEYASPEQISAGTLDWRSDIYSLGVILYELLTNNVPFTGSTPFAVMSRHLNDPVPSLRVERPDLSPAIDFVVRKALAKNPRDRYQEASELAADFAAAIAPVVVQASGMRLGGDAGGNGDLTVAEQSRNNPAPRALGPTTSMSPADSTHAPQLKSPAPVAPIPPSRPEAAIARPPVSHAPPAIEPTVPVQSPVQVQLQQATPPLLDLDNTVKTMRTTRRLTLTVIGSLTFLLQLLVISLIANRNMQFGGNSASVISLGVLLGNGLNLLILAAIGFIGVTQQRDIRGIFNRVLSVTLTALVLSGFFISYGQFTPTNLPLISYLLLLASNVYGIRELSNTDRRGESVEAAPVSWQAATVGALTGLIPLIIILAFALAVPLAWSAGNSFFLRLMGVLVVGFIGAPTPGAMMAVWLTRRMSFPILVRTSALAGLLMFVAAYIPIIGVNWLITGQWLFNADFYQQFFPLLIVGALLGLIGFLRGMLDAWIYHRVMLHRP